MKPRLDADDVLMMMRGHQMAAILRAGVELGVFDGLGSGPASAAKLASQKSADPRGVRILLDAMAALGLVEHAGEGLYRLTEVTATHLVQGGPAYMGDMVKLFTSETMWNGFRMLPDAVRLGGTAMDEHAETPGHPFWEDFARWTAGMAGPGGQRLQELLEPWINEQESVSVLDVACGTGLFGYGLAQRHRNVRVTSLDWSNVIEVTKRYVEHLHLQEQVRFLEGDMFTLDLGGPHDVVILSHVLHHFSEERCRVLTQRMADALRPGGRLVIHEFSPGDGDPRSDAFAHIFSTTMLVWTRQGEAFPESFYRKLLERCGFESPEVHAGAGAPSKYFIATRR